MDSRPNPKNIPSGTVCFLFTDIEGSTRLWEEFPEEMRRALRRHDELLRETIERANGYVFRTMGDAFCASFFTASDAVQAALNAQIALHEEAWPAPILIKVRMAIHAGAVDYRDEDYHGPPLNRIARLLATGYGDQVLLSDIANVLCRDGLPTDCALKPLGEHRLKDLGRPELVHQLCHPRIRSDFPDLKSLKHLPNNLPEQLTSFIGREAEISEVRSKLENTRLLTLTGSGGCGKTRLALQVASELVDSYDSGVWVADFASLFDANLVPQTVGSVFGLVERADTPISQALADYLSNKRLLLLVDNCEHLLSACADLLDSLLRHCPKLAVLATSREPLGISGERAYRVPPLTSPDADNHTAPDDMIGFDSVRLFVERAQCYASNFSITSDNAGALASVCRRLDGVPFAIELAAARVRSMTITEVDRRLDHRFRLLTGGSRTSLPRQQTLRSLIDWSYDLLSEREKSLLARVSVFVGGWALEAAEDICSGGDVDQDEILDLLTSLVDKSLAFTEERNGTTRYRLLETVREYGKERLIESAELEGLRERHISYFRRLAQVADSNLTGPHQKEWLDVLEANLDNLRGALDWAIERSNDLENACLLIRALNRFWQLRSYFREGLSWITSWLGSNQSVQNDTYRARLLYMEGVFSFWLGDYANQRLRVAQSLELAEAVGDQVLHTDLMNELGRIALAQADFTAAKRHFTDYLACMRERSDQVRICVGLNNLGNALRGLGEYSAAQQAIEEGLTIRREQQDLRGIAASLQYLGDVFKSQGMFDQARPRYEESLAIRREIGDRWGSSEQTLNLGEIALYQGDFLASAALLRSSLAAKSELYDRFGLSRCLFGLAALASELGDLERAARLWGSGQVLREVIDSPLEPVEQQRVDRYVSSARSAMAGDEAFDRFWNEGRAMSMEAAVGYAGEERMCGG